MTDEEDIDNHPARMRTPGAGGALQKKRSFSFLDADDYKGAKPPLVERKFLQEHVDRLEEEINELRPFRDRYYEARTKLEVLTERRGLTRTASGVSSVMLAVGGVGIGVAKDLSDKEFSIAVIIGACSLLMIGCSFLIKVRES